MVWPKGKKPGYWKNKKRFELSGENNPSKRSEVRELNSKRMKENNPMKYPENVAKMVKTRLGKILAIRKAISNGVKKRYLNSRSPLLNRKRPECSGVNHPLFGTHRPTEVKEKIRKALIGRKCPHVSERNKQIKNSERMKNGGAIYARSFNKKPSKIQLKLFERVKILYPSAITEYPYQNYFIDIAIPELKIAIEYDNPYWHKGKEKQDKIRQKEIEKGGWKFIRYDKIPNDNDLLKDLLNIQKKKYIVLTIKDSIIHSDWWTPEIKELFCGFCSKSYCDELTCRISNPWCG